MPTNAMEDNQYKQELLMEKDNWKQFKIQLKHERALIHDLTLRADQIEPDNPFAKVLKRFNEAVDSAITEQLKIEGEQVEIISMLKRLKQRVRLS